MHYNVANSYIFVNGVEIHKFKAKDSEIKAALLYPNAGLHRYVYYFRVDYDANDVDDILNIHKYLMKKNCI